MVFKPLGENRCERWNSECVLDLCNDIVCSCRLHELIYETSYRLDLIVVPETPIDPGQPHEHKDTCFLAFCQRLAIEKPRCRARLKRRVVCGVAYFAWTFRVVRSCLPN